MAAPKCAISEIFPPEGGRCAPCRVFAMTLSGRGSLETTVAEEPDKWQRQNVRSVRIPMRSDRSSPPFLTVKSGLTSSD